MADAAVPVPHLEQQQQQQHVPPPLLPQHTQQVNLHINWSHFKPEYPGKPEEDASLEPIAMTWQELQNQFRRQYSKLGNTREQLFYAWRSFHYDKNVDMPDAYVTRIRQVVRLLGY